ncbi:MAG: sigma-54-dependent Fis family transcriptional regulator [Kofleriaceae bacterium]|nr:sigma-54-dependent Fis family transcriptional regulator [Kofleriaceae bacterium]MBP9168807.1 sigma-54-dependent Fis family transcriptional regulator [Kofleriaceae bacterium]MBP9863368.1 sigma-54-dependent Fis family transcriptional regulator [Kofleriaceae bacterium]
MSEDEQRFELLADLGAMIAREVELDELLATCAARVARAIGAERATLWVVDGATGELRARLADALDPDDLRLPVGRGVAGAVAATGAPILIADAARDPRWDPAIDRRTGFTTRSMLCVPVRGPDGTLRGVLQTLNHTGAGFTGREQVFASALADQIGRALEFTTLRGHRERPGVEVRGRYNHVVGQSPTMRAVYDVIARAAQTDATVLLRGETGTGKGVFARAIHVNSARQAGPFVAVDCTTLPATLVESELFGHERGAFTGADTRVIGKVEAAAGGTLFLDELGEIPLELQGKLLRFVQERRFERVGGRTPLSSDVRLVVATNRDLAAMVKAGQFRSDLYFRVRVIEIELPALRSRGPDDVLALAEHFAALYGRRHRTAVPSLSDDARAALLAHTWPGNVRELEHAIERAVVLARGPVIDAAALGLDRGVAAAPVDGVVVPHGLALAEVERRYAAAALAAADGNQSAAARSLAISRNRLARLLKP